MSAFAVGDGYIYIGTDSGRQEIASGRTNTLTCGEGTATYDESTNTLTLENATINTAEYSAINISGSFPDNTLNIVLKGINTVKTTNESDTSVGINVSSPVGINLTAEENATLEISALGSGILINGGNFTVNGVASLQVNNATTGIVINGACNIKNSKIDIPNVKGGALNVNVGDLTIENSEFTAQNYGDTAVYAAGMLTMKNSKMTANGTAYAVFGANGVNVTDSELILNSETSNAIWTSVGSITISGEDTMVDAAAHYPALYASSTIEIKNGAMVVADSEDVAIYSENTISVSGSIVNVTSPANTDSIRGNAGTLIADSWIESHGGVLDTNAQNSDSVLFQDNAGIVVGVASLPRDVEIRQDMTLDIPVGTSLTIPEGKTLTNNGEINLEGQFIKSGNLICNSHIGGIATCLEQATCEVCGRKYGELGSHAMTYHEAQEPTCSTPGKEAYYTCENCHKYFEDAAGEKEIPNLDEYGNVEATGHHAERFDRVEPTATTAGNIEYWYCSKCRKYFANEALTQEITKEKTILAATGGTTPSEPEQPSKPQETPSEPPKDNSDTKPTDSPQTGDNSPLSMWFALLGVSVAGLVWTAAYRRWKKQEQ